MRYVDTSVLIAYLTPEAGSDRAEAFMRSAGSVLAISSWTEVELLSALGVKIRTQQIPVDAAREIMTVYHAEIAPQFKRIPVTDADHNQSMLLLDGWRSSLRAADALHLSIAAANRATIYTFDRGMVTAGTVFGIDAVLLG